MDNLNIQGDPTRDGVFDYVPGVTINPSNGQWGMDNVQRTTESAPTNQQTNKPRNQPIDTKSR